MAQLTYMHSHINKLLRIETLEGILQSPQMTKMSLAHRIYYIFVYPGFCLIFIRIFRNMPLVYLKESGDHNRIRV